MGDPAYEVEHSLLRSATLAASARSISNSRTPANLARSTARTGEEDRKWSKKGIELCGVGYDSPTRAAAARDLASSTSAGRLSGRGPATGLARSRPRMRAAASRRVSRCSASCSSSVLRLTYSPARTVARRSGRPCALRRRVALTKAWWRRKRFEGEPGWGTESVSPLQLISLRCVFIEPPWRLLGTCRRPQRGSRNSTSLASRCKQTV